jgi:hypothetical protein
MSALMLAGALLVALAAAAQLRRRHIAPPPSWTTRIGVRISCADDRQIVQIVGARGLALSFGHASIDPPQAVVDHSGPQTLLSSTDVYTFELADTAIDRITVTGIWDQMMLREVALTIDLDALPESPARNVRNVAMVRS